MSDRVDVLGWYRFDDDLTSSGQPTEPQLSEISALGVSHVVNLGLHSHERALPDEEASVRTLGMTYIHIPVDFDAPTEIDFEQFRQTMDGLAGKKVHVNCIVNARVSAFFYRYRRDFQNVPEPIARAGMKKIWTPGKTWAAFIGDCQAIDQPHQYRLHKT